MNKGFTLIELLVVVLIIGILAAVALPQYVKAVERSRSAEAIQRLGDLATAQQVWYMQHNGYAGATDVANMDISFPGGDLDTTSYDVTITSAHGADAAVMTATRNSGTYENAVLTLNIDNVGRITKSCDGGDHADFCELVASAGYNS